MILDYSSQPQFFESITGFGDPSPGVGEVAEQADDIVETVYITGSVSNTIALGGEVDD